MALGGFEYGGSVEFGPKFYTEAQELADYSALVGSLESLTGWSSHTAIATYLDNPGSYGSKERMYLAISEHTSGAHFLWVMGQPGQRKYIDASNHITNANQSGYSAGYFEMEFAYLPPGVALPGVGDPNTASWLPTGAFKFQPISYGDGFSWYKMNGGLADYYSRFQVVSRGDVVAIMYETHLMRAEGIDNLYLAGDLIATPLDPADTYGHACMGWAYHRGVNLPPAGMSTSTFLMQTYDTLGTVITNYDGVGYYGDTTTLSLSVSVGSPNWASLLVRHSTSQDSNFIKGYVNPEILRYIRPGTVAGKQTLAGGDLIYLGNGYVLGWDSLIGPMD